MSTNVSKQKREDLLLKVKEIRNFISNAPQDENTGNLLSYLSEIEKDINGKKYGLVFEEHREDIDEVLDTHTPVLTEDTDLFIDNGGQMNFLIEGDNLASLKLLEKTHKGKIDLIYIDPPYNTGNNDFVYDDNYIGSDDLFKHSKWLSFMKKRLRLAKDLLKMDGCIFISIDNNEVSQLKNLCDFVFGENSCASIITVESSVIAGPRRIPAMNGTIVKTAEYLLAYSRNGNAQIMKTLLYDYISGFDKHYSKYIDKRNNRIIGLNELLKSTPEIAKEFNTFNLPINLDNLGKIIYLSDTVKEWLYSKEIASYIIRQGDKEKLDSKTTDSVEDRLLFKYNNKWYSEISNDTFYNVFRYIDRIGPCDDYFQSYGERTVRGNLWKGFSSDGGNLAKEGEVNFKNGKKPVRLLKQIISSSCNKNNSIILDFFAGSGTTGHAVMSLNNEDGGNRQFILCTNNENNICREVTYERIRRVIDKDKYTESLKYYKVGYVPISERLYYEYANELLLHIRELVELENGINFIGNAEIAIILTDDELDDFTQNIEQYSACRKLYMGHDLLPDEDQERIIEENNIEISIIPDYYYKDLQER